ncbi:MAG: hypothetical protein WD669_01545 [Pirellulales bacterium]
MSIRVVCLAASIAVAGLVSNWVIAQEEKLASPEKVTSTAEQSVPVQAATEPATAAATEPAPIKPAPISPTVTKGVSWLIAAQHPDGGWGGGSHAQLDIRDPQKVKTDPATTAFTLLSLLRAGHTPAGGEYTAQVRKGLEYLVAIVEKAPLDGPQITDLTGTQPQSKLGANVDTPLTAQYLSRAIGILAKDDPLFKRTDAALDKCLAKLQSSQQKDGGWGQGGGWAPVLQSSLSCSALEIAQANGKNVDTVKLAAARDYQKQQVAVSARPAAMAEPGPGVAGPGPGAVAVAGGARAAAAKTDASAGVELYAFNGAFRGNAVDALEAEQTVTKAVEAGTLPADAKVTVENLERSGQARGRARMLYQAAEQNSAQIARLDDEKLLAGFGNNGGEEYLSYLLTSESLVIAGGDKFHQWNDKMHGRLQKIQNGDGSWTGLHCITSPVFCTAAVVQCLTTDRDAKFLIAMAEKTKIGGGKEGKEESVATK